MTHTPAGNTGPQYNKNKVLLRNPGQWPPWEEGISKMWMGKNALLSVHIQDSCNRPLEKKNYCSIVPLCRHESLTKI